MALVPITEAATILGKHPDTIRRFVREGRLKGKKEGPGPKDRWLIDVDIAASAAPNDNDSSTRNTQLKELVGVLRSQLDAKDLQISELHRLIAAAQRQLVDGRPRKPWWKFW